MIYLVLLCAFVGPGLIAMGAYAELVPYPGDHSRDFSGMLLVSNAAGLFGLLFAALALRPVL